MTTLALELVTTDNALQALVPEWEVLWRRIPAAAPFQSPAWLLPWWQVFGTGEPLVACLRAGARLAGLLPLYVFDGPDGRKLLPIGVGVSDYLDILLEPGLPADTAGRLLLSALEGGIQIGATICDLPDLPPGSALRDLTLPVAWRAQWQSGPPCPLLRFPTGARSCEDVVPARQRRKLRMNLRRAARLGECRVEFATSATLDSTMARLLSLNAARWGGLDETAQLFHNIAAPGLLKAGLLRLALLLIGDHVAACCYALVGGGRQVMFYLSGFDPALAEASPGSLLIGGILDAAIAEGCDEAHFLRGDESYKYAWGAQDRRNAACRWVLA